MKMREVEINIDQMSSINIIFKQSVHLFFLFVIDCLKRMFRASVDITMQQHKEMSDIKLLLKYKFKTDIVIELLEDIKESF